LLIIGDRRQLTQQTVYVRSPAFKQLNLTLEYARFDIDAWKNVTSFDWKHFQDPLIRRWFKALSILGDSALSKDKLKEVRNPTISALALFLSCFEILITMRKMTTKFEVQKRRNECD
jgi:hypothetical protein